MVSPRPFPQFVRRLKLTDHSVAAILATPETAEQYPLPAAGANVSPSGVERRQRGLPFRATDTVEFRRPPVNNSVSLHLDDPNDVLITRHLANSIQWQVGYCLFFHLWMNVFVRGPVCVSVRISRKPHGRNFTKIFCLTLNVAVGFRGLAWSNINA